MRGTEPHVRTAGAVNAAKARLGATWIALHVELDRMPVTRPADREGLEYNLRLAEELGATSKRLQVWSSAMPCCVLPANTT